MLNLLFTMASQSDGRAIFLTEQEVERIRNTAKTRLKKCAELAGQAREPRNSKTAISQATGASLMADMAGGTTQSKSHRDALPVVTVGQPYPPCAVPFKSLRRMEMADLVMETHHRGCYLTVNRVSPVVTLSARSWTVVQDVMGDETEYLEVCVHTLRHGENILELADAFVIKEPFFTLNDQADATIRIDHPSDLVACRDGIPTMVAVAENEENKATAEKMARASKAAGDTALKQKDFSRAHAEYTEALKYARQKAGAETFPDLTRYLHRNRAYLNLRLNRLDDAKSDALDSIIDAKDQKSKDLDSKAYYYAGCAAYSLGNYADAKGFFEKQLQLTPDDKDANAHLRRIEVRLREQESGIYDLKRVRAGLTRVRQRVDAATFISKKVKVDQSPGRGRGLFATSDIPAGEMIICEKAFCLVWSHETGASTAMTYDTRDDRIRVSPIGLTRSITQRLLDNSSQMERVMDLWGDYQGVDSNPRDDQMVDTFRVHDIVSRNAFGAVNQYCEDDTDGASAGLWVWAAYINHSCVPNVKREHIGDLMIIRTTRSVAAGKEIFGSYDESSDIDVRQAALMNTWGFECDCRLCSAEKADDPGIRKKRRELANEADAFMEREHWAKAKRLAVVKAQRLARAIDDTYDDERYRDLPRASKIRIQEWLSKTSPQRSLQRS